MWAGRQSVGKELAAPDDEPAAAVRNRVRAALRKRAHLDGPPDLARELGSFAGGDGRLRREDLPAALLRLGLLVRAPGNARAVWAALAGEGAASVDAAAVAAALGAADEAVGRGAGAEGGLGRYGEGIPRSLQCKTAYPYRLG